MNIGFKSNRELQFSEAVNSHKLLDLPKGIMNNTGLSYTCKTLDEGYLLKPDFKLLSPLCRNSFVPEIELTHSYKNGKTTLHLQGRPDPFVRIFMGIWLSLAALMQIICIGLIFFSEYNEIAPLFIPTLMFFFGYFLTKIATAITFKIVVKSIENELDPNACNNK